MVVVLVCRPAPSDYRYHARAYFRQRCRCCRQRCRCCRASITTVHRSCSMPAVCCDTWYLLGLASVSYACSRPGRLRAGPPGGGTGLQRKLGGAAAWRAYAAPGLLELATLGGWPNQQGGTTGLWVTSTEDSTPTSTITCPMDRGCLMACWLCWRPVGKDQLEEWTGRTGGQLLGECLGPLR